MVAERGRSVLLEAYPPGSGHAHNHEQLQSPFATDLFRWPPRLQRTWPCATAVVLVVLPGRPTLSEQDDGSTGSKLTSKG